MTVTALIVAAGRGERLGGELPKQYRSLGGKPVLRWAVEALAGHPSIDQVRVVIGEGQNQMALDALSGLSVGDLIRGVRRCAFVRTLTRSRCAADCFAERSGFIAYRAMAPRCGPRQNPRDSGTPGRFP